MANLCLRVFFLPTLSPPFPTMPGGSALAVSGSELLITLSSPPPPPQGSEFLGLSESPFLLCPSGARSWVLAGGPDHCSEFSAQNGVEVSELLEEELLGFSLGL